MTINKTLPNEILLPEVVKMLSEGHEVELRTKGASMLPFIVGTRDSVRLRSLPFEAGDIVLAELAPGHFVLHRIKSLEGSKVVLHGDGNLVGDEHCDLSGVKGKAVAIVRGGGKIVDCNSQRMRRRAKRWNSYPYIVRRLYLAIYRRMI